MRVRQNVARERLQISEADGLFPNQWDGGVKNNWKHAFGTVPVLRVEPKALR